MTLSVMSIHNNCLVYLIVLKCIIKKAYLNHDWNIMLQRGKNLYHLLISQICSLIHKTYCVTMEVNTLSQLLHVCDT